MVREYVSVGRDPFARGEIVRRVEHDHHKGCAWCGNFNRYGSLFEYGWENDARPTPNWQGRYYCSIGCMKADNS